MTASRQALVRGFFGLLLLAAAGRIAFLVVPYLRRYPEIPRFPIESAAIVFVVIGLVLLALGRLESQPVAAAPPQTPIAMWFWLPFAAVTFIVFAPALRLGFLSDDYPLFARASDWNLGAFNADAFRPLPLALWGVIHALGGGAVTVHAVNLVIHATNAALTVVIAAHIIPSRLAALAAGLFVALLPINVEAVVWSSGVFDLCATLFVLCAVIVARGYGAAPTPYRRAGVYLLVLAGVLSKEAAVVAPLLLVLDAVARKTWSKPLAMDAAIMTLLGAVYGVARLSAGSAMVREPVNRYLVQRFLFNVYGTLSVPWHTRVINAYPAIAIASALFVIMVLAWFFLTSNRRQTVPLVALAVWVLIAALPTLTFFYVAPNLEGSRYLYLSAIGWALLLAALVDRASRTFANPLPRAILLAAAVCLLVVDGVGIRLHVRPWISAAALRDQVERSAAEASSRTGCPTLLVSDLPEAVDGAFVFRNGGADALLRDRGLQARVEAGTGPCAFRWDGERLAPLN